MKSLIIFAGAGASRSVSENQYPMAVDFRKRLPIEVTDSTLYKLLITHLEKSYSTEIIDIEHILWELGTLKNTLSEQIKSGSFFKELLNRNKIASVIQSAQGQLTYNLLQELELKVTNLYNTINEQVYSLYSEAPEESSLNETWIPFLKEIEDSGFNKVDIVTTNYDLVIEEALEKLNFDNVDTGFVEGIRPGIKLDNWLNYSGEKGLLTKLHGSVDWKRGNASNQSATVIRRGHPEFDGDHSRRLILYPGFKGSPDSEPFISFHNYFKRQLGTASHIIFIGFAFRDQFINQLIFEELSKSAKVAVVDPNKDLPNHSFLDGCEHFCCSFNSKEKPGSLLTGWMPEPFPVKSDKLKEWFK